MILGRIKLEESWNIDEIESLIRIYAIKYVNAYFKSRWKKKAELRVLRTIQTSINNTYNINKDIKDIIINIFKHIRLNNKGFIDIRDAKYQQIKLSTLYREISFGNLTTPKSAIFNEALIYAVNRMRVKKYYGR